MKHAWLPFICLLATLFGTSAAHGACAEKRSRGLNFVLLAVPDGAPRPAGVDDFRFINDDTTLDQVTAKIGPPDAADGDVRPSYVYCLADGIEVRIRMSRDGSQIESVRAEGDEIYKRKKKK